MTIQITSSPTEAKIAKALKGLEITQIKAPTKIEFVIDAVDHYYEQLIKKKMIEFNADIDPMDFLSPFINQRDNWKHSLYGRKINYGADSQHSFGGASWDVHDDKVSFISKYYDIVLDVLTKESKSKEKLRKSIEK